MGDVSCFWRNSEFHDATLLLGSDSLLLEHSRKALQETFDTASANTKKRKASPAARKSAKSTQDSRSTSSDSPATSSAAAADPAATGEVLTIPVHRIVLSTGSEYFKAAISTLVGDRAEVAGQDVTRPFHPIIVAHEEDVEAAHGVLQFIYTKALDVSGSSAPQLMQLLMVADRWVVPGCVRACCKALASLPLESLSLEDALACYAPGQGPLPPSLLANPDFQPVLAATLSKLLEVFGDVPTIVASPALTEQLLRLPHAALLALLSSDALTTDCEDSVLMLLSWWLEAQQGSASGQTEKEDGEDAVAELMGAIRYCRLSSTYLAQALLLTPRLTPTNSQLAALHHFRSLSQFFADVHRRDVKTTCPANWLKPHRTVSEGFATKKKTLSLTLSAAQLDQHLTSARAMQEGDPPTAKTRESVDFKGLSLSLSFNSLAKTDLFGVFLGVYVRLPKFSDSAHLQHGVPSVTSFRFQSSTHGRASVHTRKLAARFHSQEWGLMNFTQRVSKIPGDPLVLAWWEPFMVNGHFQITAEFSDQRIE